MARYAGPKCKLCRREEVKLYLKGERCEGPRCPITRQRGIPGQHGTSRRRKRHSDFALQLREKQKLKRIYGVLERQMKNYFAEARLARGGTGEALLQELELRLDNVVYRLGLGGSRAGARQCIRQGKITVDQKKVDVPSYRVRRGQKIGFLGEGLVIRENIVLPDWLFWDKKRNVGAVKKLPSRESIDQDLDEKLIVEYYSR